MLLKSKEGGRGQSHDYRDIRTQALPSNHTLHVGSFVEAITVGWLVGRLVNCRDDGEFSPNGTNRPCVALLLTRF